ncbi:unnamed protein product [Porites evermanni]|uniref:G-protein coupled receptors family 1 profile domain-containing protein n=1 Tax=Porites evermanni TaxID=104178 RepID=A0ABN8M5S6_9CNID|nr:unnamed protein product [Porites evermanni]
MANAARLKKSSLATFYIYLVYLACYLPMACVVLAKINSKTALYFTSATLVYLNSSLNPLIYCWKMRHIRQTVMNILRTIFAIVQQATQNEDMANAARLKKSSLATFYIYLVYLACYLPMACVVLAKINSKTALYFTSATLEKRNVGLVSDLIVAFSSKPLLNSFLAIHCNQLPTETETKSTVNAMTETRGLYPTLVANCIVNAFLSYTATVLNIVTTQALRKTSSLARPLKTLLLSLTVSDLGVGLLVQPLYIALLVAFITEPNTSNSTHVTSLFIVFVAIANLLGCASFFGVVALAVDRYLAIRLHLRYQELVTHKRVVVAVILIWVLSAATFFLFLISINVRFIFSTTTGALIFATAGLLYCKIYAAVRHHTNQINALQVQQVAQNGEMAMAARQRKTAVATFFVYVVFLACYLPLSSIFITLMFNHYESVSWWHLLFYSLTLAFLNSSLNPLIYC